MAAPDFSAAAALRGKALELLHIGHFARAAAKYGAALDEARAQRCPDCLVVARLQLDHTITTNLALERETTITVAEYKARRTAAFEQTLAAAATLQRRKAAGTLLRGKCTAAEVAWEQHCLESVAEIQHWSRGSLAASLDLVQFCGYTTFLHCAGEVLSELQQSTVDHAIDVTADQSRACWTIIADALECMVQVRAAQHVVMSAEGILVSAFQDALASTPCIVPQDDVGARLRGTWRRLEISGSLQQVATFVPLRETGTVLAAADAAAADPGLRTCGLASCGAREAHPSHFKSCAACRGVAYCSKEHQTADWQSHKAACKAARKAAAAAAEGGAGPSGA